MAVKDDGDGEGGADMKRIERLRRQMLGGGYERRTRNGKVSGKRERRGDGIRTVAGTGGRKIHPTPRKRAGHDGDSESEDEEGRSSVGKSKSSGALKRGKELGAGSVHDANDDANDGVVVGGESEMRDAGEGLKRRLRGSERAGNYLDEVLADRALKRRKKRRKRGGVVEG